MSATNASTGGELLNKAVCDSHQFQKVSVTYSLPCDHCHKPLCGMQQLSWKFLQTQLQLAYQWEYWNTGMLCTKCDKIYHSSCLSKITLVCEPKPPADPTIAAGNPTIPLIKQEENWIKEDGYAEFLNENRVRFGTARSTTPYLEHKPELSNWFYTYFLNKKYDIIITEDTNATPSTLIIVTLKKEEVLNVANPEAPYIYRGIIWLPHTTELWTIPVNKDEELHAEQLLRLAYGKKELIIQQVEESDFSFFENQLRIMEKEQSRAFFKFGVIYRLPGQTENEMFSNNDVSPAFTQFLDILGDKVDLMGFTGYAGGLDIKTNGTGEKSLYTTYQGAEIMYHVSTMLPFQHNNPQQIERKRFIGNDICVIVFEDGDPKEDNLFSPELFTSNFMFVNILISPLRDPQDSSKTVYRLQITYRDSTLPFGPDLPNPSYFKPEELRDFLLCKLMNAENAVLETDYFKLRRAKSVNSVAEQIMKKHYDYLSTLSTLPRKLHRKDKKSSGTKRISAPLPEYSGDDLPNWKGTYGRRSSQSGARSVTPTSGRGHYRSLSSTSLPVMDFSQPVSPLVGVPAIGSKLKLTTINDDDGHNEDSNDDSTPAVDEESSSDQSFRLERRLSLQ